MRLKPKSPLVMSVPAQVVCGQLRGIRADLTAVAQAHIDYWAGSLETCILTFEYQDLHTRTHLTVNLTVPLH